MECDAGISAFAGYFDQAGLLQHGEVVGDGGWTEALVLVKGDAQESLVAGDLAQHGEAAGVGDGAGDGFDLLIGERCGLGGGHVF